MGKAALLNPEDTALVVIDVQEKLLPHIADHGRVLDRVVRLVRAARILDLPVLWAEQDKLGPTAAPLRDALHGLEPVVKTAFGYLGRDAPADRPGPSSAWPRPRSGPWAGTGCTWWPARRVPRTRRTGPWPSPSGAGAVVTTFEMAVYGLLGRAGTDAFRRSRPRVK